MRWLQTDLSIYKTFDFERPPGVSSRMGSTWISWNMHLDGNQFLMLKRPTAEGNDLASKSPSKINIILNWFEELKEGVPVD